MADGTICNRERLETNKALICPVWIIFRFVLLPVYRFLYFLHQISRGRSPKSFLPMLSAQKALLVSHLQPFIVYYEENLRLFTCFEEITVITRADFSTVSEVIYSKGLVKILTNSFT